ncbi:hypothetical protein [Streptomyces sp. NPDC001137]|uniref:hypothetical protein n=1 Tax=Streptomyces sp. NPDC001137 TaxID=3154378 RepID=UPI003316BE69
MSGDVLTTASTFTCQSQGVVTPVARHPLTVGKASVVTAADFVGLTVAGCKKQNQPPTAKTCVNVSAVPPVGSSSGLLTVNGGTKVLTTDGFTGATDGLIPPVPPAKPDDPPTPGKLSAIANQSCLKGE